MTLFVCMSSHVAILVSLYYFHMAMPLTLDRCVAIIMDSVSGLDAMFLATIILVLSYMILGKCVMVLRVSLF